MPNIPIIDISPLRAANRDPVAVSAMAAALSAACRTHGFFYVSGHGVAIELIGRIEAQSMAFFSLSEEEKMRIAMEKGARAWRGYFPVGGELTSRMPDLKEGIYFGTELSSGDSRVKAGMPMHGANLFPESPAGFRHNVLTSWPTVKTVG